MDKETLLSSLASMMLVSVVAAYFVMRVTGNFLVGWLKELKGMKWSPREDTPDSHLQKAGVPSMGGIGIVSAAILGNIITRFSGYLIQSSDASSQTSINYWGNLWPRMVFPLIVLLHAVLGFSDDWSKARGRGGLTARQKLSGQIVLAFSLLLLSNVSLLQLPLIEMLLYDGPDEFIVLRNWMLELLVSVLIIVGTSNAVNLTDGIDGLASGLSVQVAASFAALLFIGISSSTFAGGSSVIFFWMCLGGACLGFLAFNKYPAKVFMGDTGSLALGAALGAGAILTRTVWLLPFIGFIFFVEMFSVIFQVLYFKYTKKRTGEGKRIFRRAPLHHHFELGGWSEWRVVGTFWAVNFCTSVLGLVLWKMGILPRFP